MQYFQRFFLVIFIFSLFSCSKFEKLRKSGTDEAKYKAAVNYYNLGEFSKAGLLFEEVIPIIKGSTEQEMATFYQAYCDFHTGQYQTASFHFKQFAETFARSDYAEEAVYKSAYSLYKDSPVFNLDQASSLTAADALQSFVNNYPDSKYREEASNIIKELRVKLETKAYEKAKLYYKTSAANIANYKAAVIAITNFQREFPDSDYLEEMTYLKVSSQYNYGLNSFEEKKKERYTETVAFYQDLVDKFPNSKYLKQSEKFYDFAQKELERIDKIEKIEKAKKETEKTGKVGGATTTSN
ncbi:MAG: outer membrane protein assembly factor BamD [Bacteroidota bacterium]